MVGCSNTPFICGEGEVLLPAMTMNYLNWLRVEKVKMLRVRGNLYCLQFALENKSVKNIFIQCGEVENQIEVTIPKRRSSEFLTFPALLLRTYSQNN